MKQTNTLDRILLLITGLLAAYQVVKGIDGLGTLAITSYTIAFGALLVAGLLLIILGFEILESPLVVIVSTIIPLSLSLGLVSQYQPNYTNFYLVFTILGFLAVVITRLFTPGKLAVFVLAVVHGVAGLIIFALVAPDFTLQSIVNGPVSFNLTIAVILFAITFHRDWLEKTWRRSETRYSSLVAALSEGVVVHDNQGQIIDANPSAEHILGFPHDQLLGKTFLDPDWRMIHEDGSPFPGADHPVIRTLQSGKAQTMRSTG